MCARVYLCLCVFCVRVCLCLSLSCPAPSSYLLSFTSSVYSTPALLVAFTQHQSLPFPAPTPQGQVLDH